MKVRDLPPGRLLSVEPDATLAVVAGEMRAQDSDSVVVMSAGRMVGIITERDLVRAIADGLNPKQAKASLIMTAEPATVREDEDVSVVALRMMRLGVRHLPVVDAAGRPTGLLSAGDLVAVLDRATS